jgi:hypothetical protein
MQPGKIDHVWFIVLYALYTKKIVTKKFIVGDWVFVIFGISWQQCGGRETLWNSCSRNTFSCFCELIYGKYIMISFPFSLFPR